MKDNGVKNITTPHLYKTIIKLATLDLNATDWILQVNLGEIKSYSFKENDNIDKIHTCFDQNYTQLKACGQTMDDVHFILLLLIWNPTLTQSAFMMIGETK